MPRVAFENLTGKKFGKLTVVKYLGRVEDSALQKRGMFLVQCVCGKKKKMIAKYIKRLPENAQCPTCKEQKKESSEGANKTELEKETPIAKIEAKNLNAGENTMSETESKKTNEIVSVCNSTPSALENKLPIFVKEELELMSCVDLSNEHLFALMRGLTGDRPPADIRRVETHIADCAVGITRQIGENLKIKLATIRTAREFRV